MLAILGAHHILHVSTVKVKVQCKFNYNFCRREVALLLYRPSNLASVNGRITCYKVKIFLCKLHKIKTFLTLALHAGERRAACPACFTPIFTINCNDSCSIIYLLPTGSNLCFISYVFFQINY